MSLYCGNVVIAVLQFVFVLVISPQGTLNARWALQVKHECQAGGFKKCLFQFVEDEGQRASIVH